MYRQYQSSQPMLRKIEEETKICLILNKFHQKAKIYQIIRCQNQKMVEWVLNPNKKSTVKKTT